MCGGRAVCQVSDRCADEVRQHRQSFLSRTQMSRGKVLSQAVSDSHQLTVDTTRRPRTSSSSSKHHGQQQQQQQQLRTTSASYLVTSYHCGGPLSAAFRKLQQVD